ncbi:hypothetical protein [Bradyrhizobium sp. USDA 4472]
MFVDPVDVDSDGRLARAAFSKAYEDGLSIVRERANDAEVEALAIDILSTKPGKPTKKVLAIFRFVCVSVRQEMIVYNNARVRAFCVYDQTVPAFLSRVSRLFRPTASFWRDECTCHPSRLANSSTTAT